MGMRPVRARSLAPRNFQNTMLAYGNNKVAAVPQRNTLMQTLAARIPDLLDPHDPLKPKLDDHVMFSYTCKDGSVVNADAFRVGNLQIILRTLVNTNAHGPTVDTVVTSMCGYVERSLHTNSAGAKKMGLTLEARDACSFLFYLGQAAKQGIPTAQGGLEILAGYARELSPSLPQVDRDRIQSAYDEAGIIVKMKSLSLGSSTASRGVQSAPRQGGRVCASGRGRAGNAPGRGRASYVRPCGRSGLSKLAALELHFNHMDCWLSGALAFVCFVFVLLGVKKFYGLQKSKSGLQEHLMRT